MKFVVFLTCVFAMRIQISYRNCAILAHLLSCLTQGERGLGLGERETIT